MNHKLVEIVSSENVIAQIHDIQGNSGESYTGPLLVGYYEGGGVWAEREGRRIEFACDSLETVIKQLRRAKKMAAPKEPTT